MPIHHAVLALLAAKPAHGYELKASFERAVGEQWGGLNIGHLYQVLERLGRDELVRTERQEQRIKPDRLVHHITAAGRAELKRWLEEPSQRSRGYRDDFFLKLVAVSESRDTDALARVIRAQRTHLLRELHSLADARTMADDSPVINLLRTAAELHTRADLELVDAAEDMLTPQVLAALATGRSVIESTGSAPGHPDVA